MAISINNNKNQKPLGLVGSTSLVVGNMVGSGIFLLPTSLAAIGSISLFGWVVTTLGAIALAYVFSKLSHAYPREGGPYAYCREGLGDFVGFQIVFSYWIAVIIGNAATIVAMIAYLTVFWPSLATNRYLGFGIALATLWIITLVNVIGLKQAAILQIITTALKIIPLLLFGLVGLFYLNPEHFHHFNVTGTSNFQAINNAAILTLWAFLGLESATIPADYVADAKKTIPRATIIGTLLTALIYILCSIAIIGAVPQATLVHSPSPFTLGATTLFNHGAGVVMAVSAIVSCFSATVGWVLLQGQLPLAAARDGLFPRKFAELSSRHQTPYLALISASVIASFVMLAGFSENLIHGFTFLVECSTLAFLLPYLYTSVAQFVIYAKHRDKFPGLPNFRVVFMGVFAFIYSVWAVIGAGPSIIFYGSSLFFASGILFIWVSWKKLYRRVDVNYSRD